jgi:peptidoglycan/LPS O-acetylase OafA/YrhL
VTVSATPRPARIPVPRSTNKNEPRKGGEIRSLTGLRIVAAVWVVLFHLSWAPGSAYTRFWEPLLPLIRHGALGVDLFFVLSGFVITLTYLDKLGPRPSVSGALSFWWARICRIWPVYATVTALFGAWLVFKAAQHRPGPVALQAVQPLVDLPHWVQQMLMVQLWHRASFVGSSWVAPAWSISAEWAAYSAFPILALVLWRLRNAPPLVTGALSVLSMAPWAYTLEHAVSYPFSWAVRIAGGFAAGAFLCLAVRHIPRTERVDRIASRVVVLASLEILLLLWADSATSGSTNGGGLAVLTFPVLVGALALSTRGASRWLSTDVMVLGGKISFALYLVHMPVFEIGYTLMAWFPRLAPGTPLGTLLLPHLLLTAFVLAYLAHRFVEERSRVALRALNLFGGRRTAGHRAGTRSAAVVPVAEDLVPSARPDEDRTERLPAVVGS